MRLVPVRAALFAGTALLALSGCGDKGPPIDEAGARKIENGIREGIDRYFYDRPDMDVELDGSPKATPAGDHYDVTLPAVTLRLGDGEQVTASLGRMTARVVPLEDGTYRYEAKLPEQMQFTGADQAESLTMTYGASRIAGVWLPQYDTSLDYEVKIERLAVVDGRKAMLSTIEVAEGKQVATKKGDSIKDLDATLSMKGLSVGTQDLKLSLGGASFVSSMKDVDIAQYMAVARELQTLSKAMSGREDDPAAKVQMLTHLGRMFTTVSAVSTSFTGTDVVLAKDDIDIRIAEVRYGADLSGGRSDLASTATQIGYRGLTVRPTPEIAGLVPQAADIRLRADKLPSAVLGKALVDIAAATPSDQGPSPEQQMAAMGAMTAIAEAAGKAGTSLTADAITFTLPDAAASLTGTATVVPGAVRGVVADYTLVLTDLEKAVRALSMQPGSEVDPDRMQVAAMLGMVQTLATPGTSADGRPTHSLHLVLKEDGQVLVNDKDLSTVMQVLQGQQ